MNREEILYYKIRKPIDIFIGSLALLILFIYIFKEAENLTSKSPDYYLRGYWIMKLCYKKPMLLKSICLLLSIFLLYGIYNSIKKLIKKKEKLRNIEGSLFIDKKEIIDFKEIKKIKKVRKNEKELIVIFIRNPLDYINTTKNIFKKFILKSNYNKYGSPIIIETVFYYEKTENIIDKIWKLKNYR